MATISDASIVCIKNLENVLLLEHFSIGVERDLASFSTAGEGVRTISAEIAVASDYAKGIIICRLWALCQSDFVNIYFIELPVVLQKVLDAERLLSQLLNGQILRCDIYHEQAD
jgi:hypothetical protein